MRRCSLEQTWHHVLFGPVVLWCPFLQKFWARPLRYQSRCLLGLHEREWSCGLDSAADLAVAIGFRDEPAAVLRLVELGVFDEQELDATTSRPEAQAQRAAVAMRGHAMVTRWPRASSSRRPRWLTTERDLRSYLANRPARFQAG
jgi:hypothetical protein